jgi:hypothetical protein
MFLSQLVKVAFENYKYNLNTKITYSTLAVESGTKIGSLLLLIA